MNSSQYASVILRLGLGAVILWFGFSELFAPAEWTGWVPGWATALTGLSPLAIVYFNGMFEVVVASLLVLGISVRIAAALLFAHMLFIAFDIGLTAIGVRDFGLAAALLALVFERPDSWSLTE